MKFRSSRAGRSSGTARSGRATSGSTKPFAPGFNPESLIAEDTGIEAALKSLIDLSYVGETQLENGADVYHLAATANGPDVPRCSAA